MNDRASKSSAVIIQEVLQVKMFACEVQSVAFSGLKEGTFYYAAVQCFQHISYPVFCSNTAFYMK